MIPIKIQKPRVTFTDTESGIVLSGGWAGTKGLVFNGYRVLENEKGLERVVVVGVQYFKCLKATELRLEVVQMVNCIGKLSRPQF